MRIAAIKDFFRALASPPAFFTLDQDRLIPGDILFTADRAPVSYLIRGFTVSKFSHAAIYLGDGLYAEAVDVGVRVRAASMIVKPVLAVRRLKEGAPENGRKAVERVNHYLHMPYWLEGAVLSPLPFDAVEEGRNLFCSHLVARAYADVGAPVLDDSDPHKISPGKLFRSRKLFTVEAVVKTNIPGDYGRYRRMKTFSDDESKRNEKAYLAALGFFNKYRIAQPRDMPEIFDYLANSCQQMLSEELDMTIVKALLESKLLDIVDEAKTGSLDMLLAKLETLENERMSAHLIFSESTKIERNITALQVQLATHIDNAAVFQELLKNKKYLSFALMRDDKLRHADFTRRLIAASADYLALLSAKQSALQRAGEI